MKLHYNRLNEQIQRIQLEIEYDARTEGALRGIPIDRKSQQIEIQKIEEKYSKIISELETRINHCEKTLFVFESRANALDNEQLPDTLDEIRELYLKVMPTDASTELLDALDVTIQAEGILPRVEELEFELEKLEIVLSKRKERGSKESIESITETIDLVRTEITTLVKRKEKLDNIAAAVYDDDIQLYSYAKELAQEILLLGEYLHAKKIIGELDSKQKELQEELTRNLQKRDEEVQQVIESPPLAEPLFGVFKRTQHPYTLSGRRLYEKLHYLENKVNETSEVYDNLEKLGIAEPQSNSKKVWIKAKAKHRKNRRQQNVPLNQKNRKRLIEHVEIKDFAVAKLTQTTQASKYRLGIDSQKLSAPILRRGLPPRPQRNRLLKPKKQEHKIPSIPSLPPPTSPRVEDNPNQLNNQESRTSWEIPRTHSVPLSTDQKTKQTGIVVNEERKRALPILPPKAPEAPPKLPESNRRSLPLPPPRSPQRREEGTNVPAVRKIDPPAKRLSNKPRLRFSGMKQPKRNI